MLTLENIAFEAPAGVDAAGKPVPGRRIIDDLSLNIETGKITVITGPNGGGKSTLARLIMGIEKPTSGRIDFEGQDITAATIDERARMGIGYGFQAPARFKGMKVSDLREVAAGNALSHDEACSYLTQVGLCARDDLSRDVDTSLSGGEVKRIEIATVLARNPRLAIFDEPEAGIDLWSFDRLIGTFQKFHADQPDHALVIISHQERIMDIADNIVVIKDGRVDRQGTREEMFPTLMIRRHAANVSCGLGTVDTELGQWSLNPED